MDKNPTVPAGARRMTGYTNNWLVQQPGFARMRSGVGEWNAVSPAAGSGPWLCGPPRTPEEERHLTSVTFSELLRAISEAPFLRLAAIGPSAVPLLVVVRICHAGIAFRLGHGVLSVLADNLA